MVSTELMKSLVVKNSAKIVLFVFDGLGGLPDSSTGLTELEAAVSPNLDKLARDSVCGLTIPIARGVTPGSGPAHLSLFGYDPLVHDVGRGILSALGIDFPVEKSDVAARVNFCTINAEGLITDRRAGRIPTEKNFELAKKIEENVKVPGVKIFFRTEKEHRAALVVRGEGLSDALLDTDSQVTGMKPLAVVPKDNSPAALKTAEIMNEIARQIQELLKNDHPANMVLMRGFAQYPKIDTMEELYGMRCAAVAVYPMYRGLAKLVGMDLPGAPKNEEEEFDLLEKIYNDYDFFYVHIKGTDSAGEDGDYQRKKEVIERVDKLIPRLLALKPDAIAVTGDHSTPSQLKAHSWHPVPTMIYAPYGRPDLAGKFGERECAKGLLGTFPAMDLMPLLMAKTLKLKKYGA